MSIDVTTYDLEGGRRLRDLMANPRNQADLIRTFAEGI